MRTLLARLRTTCLLLDTADAPAIPRSLIGRSRHSGRSPPDARRDRTRRGIPLWPLFDSNDANGRVR